MRTPAYPVTFPTPTRVFGLLWAMWFVLAAPARATHVIGGQIEMRAMPDKPGHFKIALTYYFDETQTYQPFYEIDLPAYRKRDNQPMVVTRIYNTVVNNRPPLVFANPTCARIRSLSVGIVRYEGEMQLNPSDYDDPEGYYLTHQTCCRNEGIDNIRTPGTAGYTFYLEFPPLLKNGRTFVNSSPVFGTVNGEYVCRGQPFTMPFAAKDPDGDELRYSLVTPIQSNDRGSQATFPGPYPEVTWLSGFSAARAFGGSSPMSIHPKTGELSLTAAELGLFVFAVKVEEFRDGRKIGEVRRDYQLLVVDCPPLTPPNPSVEIANHPPGTTKVEVCEGQILTMTATVDPTWAYQWQKDGSNLPGENSPKLTVAEEGTYRLVTSLLDQCSRSQYSRTIVIKMVPVRVSLTVRGKPYLCGADGQVELSTLTGTPPITWYRNGVEVNGEHNSLLLVRQPGAYSSTIMDQTTGCISKSDTIRVHALPLPVANISSTSNEICRGDSLKLTATGGIGYQWEKEQTSILRANQPFLWAKESGRYSVQVTDTAGCKVTSDFFLLRVMDKVTVVMDSLPGFCGLNQPPFKLQGHPTGGTFAGPGVTDNLFYPQKAGWGRHRLTYTIAHPLSCKNGTAERTAIVTPQPTVTLPPEVVTWRGNAVKLKPGLTGAPIAFAWQPEWLVENPSASQTETLALEEEETFTLSVMNEAGCKAAASVQIRVYQRIWPPEVFTPNGDGINDVWELKGAEEYPEAQVTVYNRWGEIVYLSSRGYSRPFDGKWQGQALPSGNYAYTIKPSAERPLLRGVVTLIR